MTKGHGGFEPVQVLDALRNEAPSPMSSQQQARLLSRIEASAGLLGPGTTLGLACGKSGAHQLGATHHVGLTDQLAAHLAVRPFATLLSTLVLGGALGVVGHATVTSRHQQTSAEPAVRSAKLQAAPAVVPIVTQGPVVGIDELPPSEPALQVSVEKAPSNQRAGTPLPKRTASTEATVAPADAPNLAEQLALLETARGALQKRDATAALRALSSHAAQFPSSVLNEERDALTIKALAMANRQVEASRRMTQFEAAYPGSLLLPALRQTIGNFP